MALPGTETVRFRRPIPQGTAVAPTARILDEKDEHGRPLPAGWKRRHQGLLQDQTRRASQGPFIPSLSFAIRLLLLVRTCGAMYGIIADCDEVFNFYEPLHYFTHNTGFQTWELSPQFAIRSWTYVLLHWPLAHLGPKILRLGKRPAFFALRISLGAVSSYCEARFYRAVVDAVNERVGRYVLFMMMFSAGMYSASVSFLPSSFTMYTTMLAAAEWLHPATSTPTGKKRLSRAVFFVALGAIVGWPFSAALGVPLLFEQIFLTGGDVAKGPARSALASKRLRSVVTAILQSACIAIPVYLIESWIYGRHTLPTLNILLYNLSHVLPRSLTALLLPGEESIGGPELYGTSPPTFYLANLFLNFNFLLPLALVALPLLAITYKFDYRRLGKTQKSPEPGETSPYTLLSLRLSGFYLWLTILSLEPHKEERFFYPAYPLLCLNAGVALYLIRGLLETIYIKLTNSSYRASQTTLFSNLTLFAVLFTGILSLGRIVGLYQWYHAPLDLAFQFEYNTVPSILTGLGYTPKPVPKSVQPRKGEVIYPEWDLAPLTQLDPKVRVCWGGEWFRFPGSYLFPTEVELAFVRTDFDGMMPRPWESSAPSGTSWWPRGETRVVRPGRFNGLNKASDEPGTYVEPETCNYLVALYLPSATPTPAEPDWTRDERFEKSWCTTFLDAQSSKWWSRLVWLPKEIGEEGRVYGEYCLLKRRE